MWLFQPILEIKSKKKSLKKIEKTEFVTRNFEKKILGKNEQKVCELGFPYCFLTDFTKFFL